MGFKVQFEGGQSVEFETQPSAEDIEEAHAAVSKKTDGQKLEGQLSKMAGMGETVLGVGSGLVAAIPTGIRALTEMAGGASLDDALARSESTSEALTYKPRTATGKKYTDATMKMFEDATQDYGRAFSGDQSRLAQKAIKEGRDPSQYLKAENTERMVGEGLMNLLPIGAAARGASRKAHKPSERVYREMEEMQKASEASADRPTEAVPGKGVMDEMAGQLTAGQKSDVSFPKQVDPLQGLVEQLKQSGDAERAAKAQALLDERAAAMEQDVARQGGLDFNAAERARQEQAPTGYQEHVSTGVMDSTVQGLTKEPMGAKAATAEGPPVLPMEQMLQRQMESELRDQAVTQHPFLRKAEERVTKQEELIIKLKGQVEEGKAKTSQLTRAVKDLENFEEALQRTRDNVAQGIGAGQKPIPFDFRRQGGAINPEVFKEGFEKLKQLADGIWLRAYTDEKGTHIEAVKDSHTVGEVHLELLDKHGTRWRVTPSDEYMAAEKGNMNTQSASTKVAEGSQRQGIASELYRFASELGNDVVPSDNRTPAGKAMWEGFEKKGLAKNGVIKSPGNKQRGALQIDPNQAPQGRALENNPALKLPSIVPIKQTPQQIIERARNLPDVDQNAAQKVANYVTKGGIYQALKTDNIVVKYTHEKLHEGDSLGRGDIERHIHSKDSGLGPATRALNARDKAEVWTIVNEADRLQREPDLESMRRNGFTEEQIRYVTVHREVMDAAFDSMNRARAAAGKEPVSRRVAYAAMKATGDYRQLVYKLDSKGEKQVVGIVGANNVHTLKKRATAITEANPDYIIGKQEYYGGVPRDGGSAQQAMAHALELLSERDPHVRELMDVLDKINENEAYSFLNMKKHTMTKKGISGMEGRKAWKDAEANAVEGMQAQLDYAEAAFKWGRLSDAIADLRPVLKDQSINMPVAKEWAEGYIKNALGYNPSQLGHGLEMAFAKGMEPTGFGYSYVREGIATSRKIVNTMLLGLSPRFWAANVVQPLKSMPGMMSYLVAKGLDKNFDFGTGYSYIAQAALTEARSRFGGELSVVERGAQRYARSHHVYGTDLIEHSNRASKDFSYYADKVGGAVAGKIESGSRSLVFYSFVHMMHENGLSVKNGLYEAAHNLTDITMNNYSRMEQPKYLSSLGPLGHTATNLASFKHNELSRTALFIRQAKEEKSLRPILAELTAGIAFAGLTGTVLFSEIDDLYKQATAALGKPESLTALAIRLSEKAGKAVNAKTGAKPDEVGDAKYVLSHGGFSMLGIDMSKSLGLQDVIPDNLGDAAFPGGSKLVSMAGSAYTAARHPSEMNTKRMAREWSPAPVASNMDLEWFSKNGMGNNRENLKGQVPRTDLDIAAKRFGFTGIHENVYKTKKQEADLVTKAYAEKRVKALHTVRDEMFANNGKVSTAAMQKYLNNEGDLKTLLTEIARFGKQQNIPEKDLELMKSSAAKSITSLRHAQRLQRAYSENE